MSKLHLPAPDRPAPKTIKIGGAEFKITTHASTLKQSVSDGNETIRILRRAVKDGTFTSLDFLENEKSIQT
jgi:hypothetical protein